MVKLRSPHKPPLGFKWQKRLSGSIHSSQLTAFSETARGIVGTDRHYVRLFTPAAESSLFCGSLCPPATQGLSGQGNSRAFVMTGDRWQSRLVLQKTRSICGYGVGNGYLMSAARLTGAQRSGALNKLSYGIRRRL